MEAKEINKRIYAARSTIFKEGVLPHQLEGALKSMLNVKDNTQSDDLRADEYIAKIYYLMGDYDLSNETYRYLLSVKPNTPKYLLGIYKNNILLGNVDNIISSLNDYKESLDEDKKKMFDTRLIDTLLHYCKTGEIKEVWNSTNYMYFDASKTREINDIYFQLCMAVNAEDFNRAINLASTLENYVRKNNIHVEFFTLISLLKNAENIRRSRLKDNLNKLYSELRDAVDRKDTGLAYRLLNDLVLFGVKDTKLILQAINLLIEDNFVEEAVTFIEKFNFGKGYKEQIKILRKNINEVMYLIKLDDELSQVYEDAVSLGRYYYKIGDLVQAIDAYSWGLYVTEGNIFNYYIGKMLYKQNRLKEARDYLLKYVEIGGNKLDKAYLYLSKIFEKYGNKKKSVHYSRLIDYCNDVTGKVFDFSSPFDESQDVDMDKYRMQRRDDIGEEYFGEDKLEDLETYVRLIKEGKRVEADQFLEGLKNIQDKSGEQKLVLRIIDRNKKLYDKKRV